MVQNVKQSIIKNLEYFENFSKDEIYEQRKAKFLKIGREGGFTKSTNLSDGSLSYKELFISKAKRSFFNNQYIYYSLLAFLLVLIAVFTVV